MSCCRKSYFHLTSMTSLTFMTSLTSKIQQEKTKTNKTMATNEETTAMGGKEKDVKNGNGSKGWKNVVIGSTAGVMLGAGSAYAAGQLAAGEETADSGEAGDNGRHDVSVEASDVATVDQGQSFGEAFAQARAEVGPGGVFRWHGGVYGTYTKDEWDAMSPEGRQQFSQNAMRTAENVGEGSTGRVETAQVQPHADQGGGAGGAHSGGEAGANNNNTAHNNSTPGTSSGNTASPDNTGRGGRIVNNPEHENGDVRVVGVHEEQLGDGTVVTVGTLDGTGSDTEIMVVDVDQDSVFDVAISDRNRNGRLDEGEIEDISGLDLRVPGTAADPNLHTARNEELAPGMPDYMNDADVPMA